MFSPQIRYYFILVIGIFLSCGTLSQAESNSIDQANREQSSDSSIRVTGQQLPLDLSDPSWSTTYLKSESCASLFELKYSITNPQFEDLPHFDERASAIDHEIFNRCVDNSYDWSQFAPCTELSNFQNIEKLSNSILPNEILKKCGSLMKFSIEQIKGPCSGDNLSKAFKDSIYYRELAHFKYERMYLPPAEYAARNRLVVAQQTQGVLSKVIGGLDKLNEHIETYLLVYGLSQGAAFDFTEKYCIWLIGREGIVASDVLNFPGVKDLDAVRNNFGVTAERISSRSSHKRRADGDCETMPPESETDRNNSNSQANSWTVEDFASKLIGENVLLALNGLKDRNARLLVLSKGNLEEFPFAAIPLAGKSLVDFFYLKFVPEVDGIAKAGSNNHNPFWATQNRGKKLSDDDVLLVGNPDLTGAKDYCWPDLQFAEKEANSVQVTLGIKNGLFGSSATKAQVLSKLELGQKKLKLIYFATHAQADSTNPTNKSIIALTSGNLEAATLRNFHFAKNPLIVLSACQTGLGKILESGVFGFSSMWEFAGADTVIASLWNVEDQGNSILMQEFLKELVKVGFDYPEVALGLAVRKVKADNPDPAIWAAVEVIGKPH